MDDTERKALGLLADALGTSVDYLVENRNTPNMTSYDKVLSAVVAALTPPEGYVLIQRVDAKRLVQGDTNSPGYELSCRRVGAMLAHHEEAK